VSPPVSHREQCVATRTGRQTDGNP
jgi:hypothetical protein